YHPCQILADLVTLEEHRGSLDGLVLAYVGDGNNIVHSWINAAGLLGFELRIGCPKGYEPDKRVLEVGRKRGGKIRVIHDPFEAVKDAEAVYTDVWASMGQEAEAEARKKVFAPYQVNKRLLRAARKNAYVMHCLPAHRGEEITADVIEGPRSIIFDEAENRLHAQKAVLEILMTTPRNGARGGRKGRGRKG
ncbi:MAG: ornithine carbamoyltransferase, partial [Candidatus Methylomirabilis sp.]|nr:ornithine carbamoyltransferase [Deltaproteobacteria bacterium]